MRKNPEGFNKTVAATFSLLSASVHPVHVRACVCVRAREHAWKSKRQQMKKKMLGVGVGDRHCLEVGPSALQQPRLLHLHAHAKKYNVFP